MAGDISVTILSSDQPRDRMFPGDVLNPGDTLYSIGSEYMLRLEDDGNLVLYHLLDTGNKPKWATNTTTGKLLRFQTDGQLVLFDGNGTNPSNIVWAMDGPYWPPVVAILQTNGAFVVYGIAPVFDTTKDVRSLDPPVPVPAPLPVMVARSPSNNGINITQIIQTAQELGGDLTATYNIVTTIEGILSAT